MVATGWGTIVQSDADGTYQIDMHAGYGEIVLNSVVVDDHEGGAVSITNAGVAVNGTLASQERRHEITLPKGTVIAANTALNLSLRQSRG